MVNKIIKILNTFIKGMLHRPKTTAQFAAAFIVTFIYALFSYDIFRDFVQYYRELFFFKDLLEIIQNDSSLFKSLQGVNLDQRDLKAIFELEKCFKEFYKSGRFMSVPALSPYDCELLIKYFKYQNVALEGTYFSYYPFDIHANSIEHYNIK